MPQKTETAEHKVPRTLYRNEIGKHFSSADNSGYNIMLNSLWNTGGVKVVKADNGFWYEAAYVEETPSKSSRLKMKKLKSDKSGKPISVFY
jgi:hypothetical protein